jgi:hypothetical protein
MQSIAHGKLLRGGVENRSGHALDELPDPLFVNACGLVALAVDDKDVVEAVEVELHVTIVDDARVHVVRRQVPETCVLRPLAGEVIQDIMNHHDQFASLVGNDLVASREVHQVNSGHFSAFRSWVEIR